MSSKFSFTNTSESKKTQSMIDIQTQSAYALRQDEPDACVLTNTTANIDQPELVTYQSSNLNKVPSKITNMNPPKVSNAIQYGVRLDELLRVTDTDGNTLYDLPIVVNLTVKHNMDCEITADVVDQVIARLIGAYYKPDGSTRTADLMRSALKPTV